MNISATSLALLTDLQNRLTNLYPTQVRFLPRVGNHNTELDGLINQLSRNKSQQVDQVWLSYYFSRGSLDYIDNRIREVYWPDPTNSDRAFQVRAIPLATLDIAISFVSNHAPLLEDLEQKISLRHFPLQRSFVATAPILTGLDPIKFWYDLESPNPNYRVEATSLGSVSELSISLRIYFPIFQIPENTTSQKIIKEITFDIYSLPENLLLTRYTLT